MKKPSWFSSVMDSCVATAFAPAVLVLPLLGGCAAAQPNTPIAPPPLPPTGTVGLTMAVTPAAAAPAVPTPPAAPIAEPNGPYSMYITEVVRTTCSGPDPFFAFDVSKPSAGDQPTMKSLVQCMTTGPMRGKTIRLIGHTDPRGTAAFNTELGLQRAENVKKYMVAHGVDQARVETASMGSEDAARAPKQWAQDRRVEVQVVP